MAKVIMVGCDLHQASMLLMYCIDDGKPQQASFHNTRIGRADMIEMLRKQALKHDAPRIVLAYEASSLGYGLCDELYDAGIECYVLSPTLLPKTAKSAKLKTDAKDAMMLLEQLRGHLLAGNSLPAVWTPSQRLRDDRELVRARVDGADETTRVKLQILSMFKRRGIELPGWRGSHWTKRFVAWLKETAAALDPAVAVVLENLIERFEMLRRHENRLTAAIAKLAKEERYRLQVEELRKLPGVGLLTAMTFLTEIGDLSRFHNRRELTAYLGLCPSSHESGEAGDRKGHITRQGPARVRRLLCQASWLAIGRCSDTKSTYQRIRGGKKQRTKKALVAVMRLLAIKMWHRAQGHPTPPELVGRGGPHCPLRATALAA
jgi:transposase